MAPTPVLLLHGSAASGAQWRSLAAALSPQCLVHAPDLMGYGQSPWPPTGQAFRLRQEAAPLLRWLQEAGRPVHVIAHSYGAAVALQLARTRPADMASLLLYEPAAFHLLRCGDAQDQRGLQEITAVADAVRHAACAGPLAPGAACFVDYWNGPGSWAALPSGAQAAVLQAVPKVALEFGAALHEPSQLEQLRGLRMPRTLVQGERSPLAARRVMARLAAAWPDAALAVLSGAGHMGPVTHRPAFQLLVERHLGLQRVAQAQD